MNQTNTTKTQRISQEYNKQNNVVLR